MSENISGTDALDAFVEVLESVTMSLYATDRKTNMRTVATEVLTVLGQFGWELRKINEDNPIDDARKLLAESKAMKSSTQALQGILTVLIAQQENPYYVYASSPAEDNDTPDQGLWGGQGARG